MNITKIDNAFVYHADDGTRGGEMTFSTCDNDVIIANHTWVKPQLRGQGIARALLDTLVNFARQNNLRIAPQCSYIAHVFAKYPDQYRDISVRD